MNTVISELAAKRNFFKVHLLIVRKDERIPGVYRVRHIEGMWHGLDEEHKREWFTLPKKTHAT